VILCSGKVYYDLLAYRKEHNRRDVALIRVEQLYPFCEDRLKQMVSGYPAEAQLVWCQEESQNMGSWSFIAPRLQKLFEREIAYAGREASASPAVGALALHKREQAELIAQAFGASDST
jgi:2-oxoglutarate dehydrogenase E1 component